MSECRKTLRELYNEELDERIIDLLQSDRLSEEDCELVSELGTRFIQQRQDQSLIETNLKGELDFREAKIANDGAKIDAYKDVIEMLIEKLAKK